ncbi:MAG: sucrose synthase, partial [Planctomycetes bacterium]|nr:sucrose synthase [Planctomycetota bacterium]
MIETFVECLSQQRQVFYLWLHRLQALGKPFVLRSDLQDALGDLRLAAEEEIPDDSPLWRIARRSQEAAISPPWVALAMRPRIGVWSNAKVHMDRLDVEPISTAEYLLFKERLVDGQDPDDEWSLEVDLGPFQREFPRMREAKSIGRGVEFLNRHLAGRLLRDPDQGSRLLLEFLKVHQHQNVQLMLNRRVETVSDLRGAIRSALERLARCPEDKPWAEMRDELQALGFEPGWGDTARRVAESLEILSDLLEAPEPAQLGDFLGRLPMIFKIVILSPHGYFGQDNVLGLPDTGGQIVYILNQIRALEEELQRRMREQGLEMTPEVLVVTRMIPEARGTNCDQRLEPIAGTQHSRILRIPFRSRAGEVVPHWISRFEVWPYLERFARDAEREILAELGGRPDLIVGNYSDGNLVSSLLAQRLRVTQCTIAHALEKSKYLLSDLYWRDIDGEYHFSCQFMADLVSMNTADFILTSTYQEIAGTEETIGQYESYGAFAMPGLCRVVQGIDVFDPKFNIVSPGAAAGFFFPYFETDRRMAGLHAELSDLVYGGPLDGRTRGVLENREKPILLTMARLDRVKNLAGLVEWFAKNDRLRERCNLLVSAGHVDPD